MQSELGLNVEGKEYTDFIYLNEAIEAGEIDIATGLIEENANSKLYYSKSIYKDYEIVVTTVDSPIHTEQELIGTTVGFLSSDKNYAISHEQSNMNFIYYDTLKEVKQALLNNEIQAFVGNSYLKDAVVRNSQLISRIALHDNPSAYRVATGDQELEELVDLIGTIINNSTDMNYQDKLVNSILEYETTFIGNYINEKYPNLNELPSEIKVNTLSDSFPNSYTNKTGKYEGKYIDVLDYFSEKTGINYTLNENALLKYSEILHQLNNNNIQLVIGAKPANGYSNIQEIPLLNSDDYVITIQNNEFDNSKFNNLDDLRIGISAELENYAKSSGFEQVMVYNTTLQAISGLENNEFDVLITYKSVLEYYQKIKENSSLIQSNFILKEHPTTIMVNRNNEEVNNLLQDVLRIYTTMTIGEIRSNDEVASTNQINEYLKVKERQNNIILYSTIITIIAIILFTKVVLQLRKEHKLLEFKYTIDELTGISNRNSYKEKIKKLIDNNQNRLGVYIFLDLNYFKQINDTYGHHNGDTILVEFAKGLKSFEDKDTISFRIAGDEFGIYAAGFETIEELNLFVQKIATYPYGDIELDEGSKVAIKYSLGYTIYPVHASDIDILHEYADFAMYRAKETKDRNEFNCQVSGFCQLSYSIKHSTSMKIEEVKKVIEQKDIYTIYQPIINLENGDLVGYEGITKTNNPRFATSQELVEYARKGNLGEKLDRLLFENIIMNFHGKGNLYINIDDRDIVVVNHLMTNMFKKLNKEYLKERIILEICDRNEFEQISFSSSHKLIKDQVLDTSEKINEEIIKLKKLFSVYPKVINMSRSLYENIEEDNDKLEYLHMLVEFGREHEISLLGDDIKSSEEVELMKLLGVKFAKGSYLCELIPID